MRRNIPILYALAFFGNAWVWLAIWALYYLTYTDYAGVGLLEMITFFTVLVIEIPSGALADLLGKKGVLIAAYLLLAGGNVMMGLADGFSGLVAAVLIIAVGFAFLSGAFEAITYDTLDELGEEDRYEKIYSKQNSIKLFTHAIAALVGGFVFAHNESLPFILTGVLIFTAAVLACFLREPPQSVTASTKIANVFKQNIEGFRQLFSKRTLLPFSLLFLLVSIVPVMLYEYAAELTLIEKGATAEQMGIFITAILFFAAMMSYFSPFIIDHLGRIRLYVLIAAVYVVLALLVPSVGLWIFFAFNLFWAGSSAVRNVIESKVINMHIDNNVRATTLSTLSMLKLLPHASTATFLGALADLWTISLVVYYLGIAMAVFTLIAIFQFNLLKPSKL